MRFQPEILDGIQKIKSELASDTNRPQHHWLLNMSSYSFLYADFSVEPPRGTHLGYNWEINLFHKDYSLFLEQLKENPFRYILLQEAASGTPRQEFREYLRQLGYAEVLTVDNPKSGVDGIGRGKRFRTILYKN